MTKNIVKYGLITSGALILYFLISKTLGLHQYPVFSSLNAVILGIGIFFAMKSIKISEDTFKYQKGFQVGFFTGFLATIVFTSFMAFYIYGVDVQFAQSVIDSYGINYEQGSFLLLVTLSLMGFSTSFVLALCFMQLLKRSWNTSKSYSS